MVDQCFRDSEPPRPAPSKISTPAAVSTIQPSAVLRARTPDEPEMVFAGRVADLGIVAAALETR